MQEIQDKTFVEIVKACKGSFIYAPGGTVNIGCVVFDGPSTPKKPVPQKAEPEAEKTTRRRKSATKVNEKVEPPKGDSAPPPPVYTDDDDDNQGDGSTSDSTPSAPEPSNTDSAAPVSDPTPADPTLEAASAPADPAADSAPPPFRRQGRSRRRDANNGA